jgi:hypothetical protein
MASSSQASGTSSGRQTGIVDILDSGAAMDHSGWSDGARRR